LLVTAHRRENWGEPMENICRALREIVETFKDVRLIFAVHRNPIVRNIVFPILEGRERVELREPPDYFEFVSLMQAAHLILTDSGGVQEEAPALGKPVLVLRRTTERPEGIGAGTAKLVGTNAQDIVREATTLLTDESAYAAMSRAANPYGDGRAAERIAQALLHYFGVSRERPEDFQRVEG
jgi:UDP-N-acetylglucosamine 2-epimerase (non-hydrolysing)